MATIKHVFTSPKADGADTDLVRPSDWNSVHLVTLQEAVSLSGNTAGALALISSGTLYLAGGNNITLSQNANSVTVSGGDTSQFLTTAMASNAGSNFVQANATIAGTNVTGTIASNVISLSVDPSGAAATDLGTVDRAELDALIGEYIFAGSNITISESPTADAISIFAPDTTQFLTTAMASNAGSQWVYTSAGLNLTSISATLASNSISLSVGAYITTARASTDAIGLNTAKTNVTWTVNSSGISLDAGGYAGTGFTSTTTAGTEIEATNNTAGLSMAVPNWLTTAMVSAAGSNFVAATATVAGTNITGTIASNVISLSVADPGNATDLGTLDRMELDAQPWEYVFAGSNVTLSESPDGGAMTIHAGGGTGGNGSINFSAGTTSGNLDSMVLADSNGISFGLNGSTITATVATNYLTTAMVSNAGSQWIYTSAGLNLTSISATLASNSITLSVGPYITTAMVSDAGSRFVNTSAGLNLTSISATFNSNSISLSVGPYLTTAMTSGASTQFVQGNAGFAGTNASGTIASSGISVNVADQTSSMTDLYLDRGELEAQPWDYIFAGSNITISESPDGGAITLVGPSPSGASVNFSAGTTSNDLTQLVFADSNGVAFGLNAGTITATVDAQVRFEDYQGSFLQGGTFSLASDRSGIDLVIYAPSQGASSIMGVLHPDYVPRDAELDANIGEYIFAGSNITISESPTADAISIFAPDTTQFLTTAMASNAGSQWVYTTAGLNLTSISATLASNSISLSVGPYITTARASTDAIGLNTAETNVTWTVNSSGLSLDAGGYAGTGTTATNATLTLDSNGLAISIGAGGDNSMGDWLEQGLNNPSDYIFGSNLTITENSDTDDNSPHGAITISAPATSLLTGVGGISISTNGSTISVSGSYTPLSMWANVDELAGFGTGASAITASSGSSMWIQPFTLVQPVSASYLRMFASFNDSAVGTAGTTSANQTFSAARFTTYAAVLYSQGSGANSQSIQYMFSTSAGMSGSTQYGAGVQGSRYTITISKSYPALGLTTNLYTTSYAVSSGSIVVSSNSNTLFTGPLYLDIPWATSMSVGNYWLGIGASTSSTTNSSHISFAGTAALPVSLNAVTQTALSMGILGAATSASRYQVYPGLGGWTTNASLISTSSVAISQISQVANNPILPFQFIRQA